eukprot:g15739.t1
MSGPLTSAMDNHLQRYGTSDAGDDSDTHTRGVDTEETSFWGIVFAETPHPFPNFFARWWRQHHPFIVQFLHDYGSVLVQYLAPFTPGAARRAGYCCAAHDLRRSLDRVDVALPGAESGWSSRWRSRCAGGRGSALPGRIRSVSTAVGGAGVAAVVVLLAAAVSWCSWRRSPPGWPILLGEVAIGSAGLAHYLARDDGHHEAKGRLSAAGGSRPGMPEVALRELRSVLIDVLEGGVRQASALNNWEECAVEGSGGGTDDFFPSEGRTTDAANGPTSQVLADLVGRETQLVAGLRRFVAGVAAKVNGAMAEPEVWGLWWDSRLEGVSEAVRELAIYFEAAGERLEAAIGSSSPPFSASFVASHGDKVAAAAEALSSLRLHYEEILVRLYSCQSNANSIVRDPAKSTEDLWEVLRRGLADARLSTGPLNCDHELWQKAEHLVKCITNDGGRSEADFNPGASTSENQADNSRHLEAGVGWVSLTTPREEGPSVFEGGSGDEGGVTTQQSIPDTGVGVTDVLVGVPSPGRGRPVGELIAASTATPEELVHERFAESKGSQNLMSELRAQLSSAANEEIFCAASSDEEESISIGGGDP